MYYLKLYDENLISFNMDNKFGLSISNIKILSSNHFIFPVKLKDEINEQTIEDFISSRIIPKNRAFVQNILEQSGLNINDKKAIIDVSKGLSLTDSYWITNDDTLKYADYNLYDNDFSNILSLVAFTGYSSKIKDLATSPEFSTNGMLPKGWRRINHKVYLYKGSTQSYHFANTGYEPYSEFYASQVAKKMGINHVEYGLSHWKHMLASTCPLFTNIDISYVPICDVVPRGGIKAVYDYIKKLGFTEDFSNMILFDALVMNVDRHFGNFGLLRNNKTGKFIGLAPVFDNGESLLCKALPDVFLNYAEFKKYIEKDEVNISYYGISYNDLVKEFCNKSHITLLRKLLNFEFQKHSSYNLSSKRLRCLNYLIESRAKKFIDIINNNSKKG